MITPVRRRRAAALSAAVSGIVAAAALVAACTGSGEPAGHGTTRSSAAVLAGRSRSAQPGSQPAGSRRTGPALGALGTYRVGQRRITFVEPAHTGRTGQHLGPRSLLTLIRYPEASRPSKTTQPAHGPLPLIVFGPGFMQCGGPYSQLLQAWASAGYVVAVVNFPHADCKVGSAATEADLVNEPGDMSYVISRMLALSVAPRGLFSGLIDRHEIAVSGHSDGADTVAAITANTCCTDYRIVAVAVLSGAEWPPMPGRYFPRRPVPMLFTQGSADTINPPGCSVAMYRADPAHSRYYLDLLGSNHTIPYWGTNPVERIVARVTLAFFDRYVLRQAAAGPLMKRDGNVGGKAALFSAGGGQLRRGPCS
jgi:dienelactone hydrolase